MESSQNNKKASKKNFMWTTLKSKFLTSYLAECAKNGEKNGKSFTKSTYKKAAEAVSTKFPEDICKSENVDSWMKTAKKRFGRIMTLRERSGWAWDDELKMIKVNRQDALEFIEENSYAKDLLNVPLVDFDDMRLICGEDQAIGSHARSFGDIPTECINVDETSETQGASTQLNTSRGKRSRPWEEAMAIIHGLTDQVA